MKFVYILLFGFLGGCAMAEITSRDYENKTATVSYYHHGINGREKALKLVEKECRGPYELLNEDQRENITAFAAGPGMVAPIRSPKVFIRYRCIGDAQKSASISH